MVNPDFRDLFAALNEAEARYLVVGAHAVAFYAEPRFTKDLDVWVEASAVNAPRAVLQIGVAPNRIDITTHIDGVAFAEAWPNRLVTTFGDQSIGIIGRAELIKNKTAVARPQDLLDLSILEKHG